MCVFWGQSYSGTQADLELNMLPKVGLELTAVLPQLPGIGITGATVSGLKPSLKTLIFIPPLFYLPKAPAFSGGRSPMLVNTSEGVHSCDTCQVG